MSLVSLVTSYDGIGNLLIPSSLSTRHAFHGMVGSIEIQRNATSRVRSSAEYFVAIVSSLVMITSGNRE